MKKILSLDGGGIRGIIPARVLQSIEEELECRIADIFDLIVGTSTGGILALGLSKGGGDQKSHSAKALVKIYDTYRTVIFDPSVRDARDETTLVDEVIQLLDLEQLQAFSNKKYSDVGLNSVLNKYFKEATLQDVQNDIKVMVTCYDIQARSPVFLKNWYPQYRVLRMKDAARATAAAPTFFEPIKLHIGGTPHVLVDGGIFVNTPTVSAYAEAKSIYPDETDFFLLSLGTGSFTRPFSYEDARGWRKYQWVSPLIDCIMDGQQDAANYHMRCLLEPKNYYRFTAELDDDTDEMDNVSDENIGRLRQKAAEITNRNDFGRCVDRLKQLV
ncbi:MAG: patatin-like phospholipase family protein [Candidatus Poribacteria bacterium]|nr:patatin-like phospholipase family protein [Candidatus Poribacteria bacterium]